MEQNKMTPAPWNANGKTIGGEIGITAAEGKYLRHIATLPILGNYAAVGDEYYANALAIVTAVNNTYGAGINPEAVPNMKTILEKMIIEISGYSGFENWYLLSDAKKSIENANLI